MKIISHRGNISGRNIELENHPCYIKSALDKGYDVEVDVWCINNKWMLGHDEPVHYIDISFLRSEKIWCHAKNLIALNLMISEGVHCFWHEQDDYTLTSKNYIWTYPNKNITPRSVIVYRDIDEQKKLSIKPYGVCIDDCNVLNNFF